MFMLDNNSNRPVKVIVELRHIDPPLEGKCTYLPCAFSVLQRNSDVCVFATLATLNQFNVVSKGLISDAREVCFVVELAANSSNMVMPYTKHPGELGQFKLSVYPQGNPIGFQTVHRVVETCNEINAQLVVDPAARAGSAIHFAVGQVCDIQVLIHQNRESTFAKQKGEII
ncbi:hypothetical protein AGDE_13507 [Angomonas deanei]|nr:hypothetical protein AGDE_13507 [Angomonas deanei]|eukprot:EPY22266.1 hypothetical protein AGDE_13507 [Angomonas deanei]